MLLCKITIDKSIGSITQVNAEFYSDKHYLLYKICYIFLVFMLCCIVICSLQTFFQQVYIILVNLYVDININLRVIKVIN